MSIRILSPVRDNSLLLEDAAGEDALSIRFGGGTTAQRSLTLVTGDADRVLTLNADVTLPTTDANLSLGIVIAQAFKVLRY